jgi:hypothetical protein
MLESAVVIGIVVLAHVLVIHMILRRLGIGKPHGKPDCGCGTCHTKRVRKDTSTPDKEST